MGNGWVTNRVAKDQGGWVRSRGREWLATTSLISKSLSKLLLMATRNPGEKTTWDMYKTLKNNGINSQINRCKISEPSIV